MPRRSRGPVCCWRDGRPNVFLAWPIAPLVYWWWRRAGSIFQLASQHPGQQANQTLSLAAAAAANSLSTLHSFEKWMTKEEEEEEEEAVCEGNNGKNGRGGDKERAATRRQQPAIPAVALLSP